MFNLSLMKTIATALIAIASVVTVMAQDREARLDALRAEGYEALYNLDYAAARAQFQKMIELAPEHPAGAQCYASSFWVQQLNEVWALKASLYSAASSNDDKTPPLDRKRVEEFHRWARQAKLLSQARLRKDPRDVGALYFLGAAEGLEAAFLAGFEKKYMPAFRSGTDSVEHHRAVLKIAPAFHDAELTIGLFDYVVGSLPLPAKWLAATMGVRGSKKRGLEALGRVATEGKWARDVARMVLIDLYKRERRFGDAAMLARELSEKYPRNYLFKLQMADALTSQVLALRKAGKHADEEEKQLQNIFTSLSRDKTLDPATHNLVQARWTISRRQLTPP